LMLMIKLLHDVTAESCYRDDLIMTLCRCQVIMVMVLLRRLGYSTM
jgi:hypothetical protein